jgi:serine/threonine protein phosphatase PrpC
MARPAAFDKHEKDFIVSIDGISIAETVGERASQQDAIFVANVGNREACADPKGFFERKISEIVDRHKACESGTTLCSAIVTAPSEEDLKAGKTFPKITIANLGDSRAAIIAKTKDGRYISIILTEDHDLRVPRIVSHVESLGGKLAAIPEDPAGTQRVVYHHHPINPPYPTLNMGAAIGDCHALGVDGRHVLMTRPDIFEYDLNSFPFVVVLPDGYRQEVLPKDQIQELDLIVSCDGLYDVSGLRKLAADFRVHKTDVGIAFLNDNAERTEGLSEIKKAFDEERGGEDGGKISFAEALQDLALSECSSDNISIACVSIVSEGKSQITEPLMTTVCDGHGATKSKETVDPISAASTGEEVSASVASMIYLAAKAEHIAGLEMPRNCFHAFLEKDAVATISTLDQGGAAAAESPPFAVGGGGGGGGVGGDRRGRERGGTICDEEEAGAAGWLPVPPSPALAAAPSADVASATVEVMAVQMSQVRLA